MLHGFHVIFSTYGFWLPNDPRGSWSDWIRNWELLRFGPATKVETRRSVAGVNHDVALRKRAKAALKYPEVFLTGRQAQLTGFGFRAAVAEADYSIFACSIMPQHVHLVVGPHEREIDRIVGHLKARATQGMKAANLHPLGAFRQEDGTLPSPWGRKCWKVFVFSPRHLRERFSTWKAIRLGKGSGGRVGRLSGRSVASRGNRAGRNAEQAPPLNGHV